MKTMGLFSRIKEAFGPKKERELTRFKTLQLEDIKKFYSSFDFTKRDDHYIMLYNGFNIGNAFDTYYMKNLNWQVYVSDMEKFEIEKIYQELDRIYNV